MLPVHRIATARRNERPIGPLFDVGERALSKFGHRGSEQREEGLAGLRRTVARQRREAVE